MNTQMIGKSPLSRWRMVVALVASLALPATAADPYPSQPVRLVVGWAAGGAVDALARALALKLGERWKREVIVENKPGASEIIGATTVASAKPDGHTLFMATDTALQSNEFLFSKLPYSIKSFAPVTRVSNSPLVLLVRAESIYQSVPQLVAAAKQSPGKITYSSNGLGGQGHLASNWFAVKADVQFTHVPYKGGAPAMQAVLAGEVDMVAVGLGTAGSFLQSGKLRALAVTSPKRMPVLPAVPSLTELGYDVDVQVLNAIVAPAGTPPDIVAKIATDVAEIIADPAFSARNIEKVGNIAIGDSPKEFADYLVRDASRYRAQISAANVKLD